MYPPHVPNIIAWFLVYVFKEELFALERTHPHTYLKRFSLSLLNKQTQL